MAKQASKELNQSKEVSQSERSPNGDLIDINLTDQQTVQKDGELSFHSPQNPEVIAEIHPYHEPLTPTPIAMDTDGPSYNQDQDVALSNLNPVPISLSAIKHSSAKDPIYSHNLPTSYAEQNLMYLNESTDNNFSSRPLPAHMSQPHSAESYAAMLSSFLNSKNPSQISPHQTLPSLLPLNMQNYQSTGQHHPMILNHLLTQMEEAGYSSLARPTSVPTEESVSYQPQLRPHSVHSMDNLSYRNTSYQSQGHFESDLSPSDESYQQGSRYSTSIQHQSPAGQRESYNKESSPYNSEIILQATAGQSDARSNRKKSGGDSSADKSMENPRNREEYQDIAQLAYNQS